MKIKERLTMVKFVKHGNDVEYDNTIIFDNLLYESEDKINIGAHIEEYGGNKVYLGQLYSYFKDVEDEGEVVIKTRRADTIYPESVDAGYYLNKDIYLTK